MGGFALALGGAGQAAEQYGAQQRQILESRRHDFQNLVGQTLTQPGISPEFRSYLFGLGGDIAAGKNMGPLIQGFQQKFAKEQQGNAQIHQTIDAATGASQTPPPPPPPGPVSPGQVAGGGSNAAAPPPPVNASLPPTSPIAGGAPIHVPASTPGGMAPGMVGPSLQDVGAPPASSATTAAPTMLPPPPSIAPAPVASGSASLTPPPVATGSWLNDQYQLNPLEQMQMQQYQHELASPWGPSARTEAAMVPIFQRMAQLSQLRGTAAVDVEKANATFQQNLEHAKQLFGPDYAAKLAPELLSELASTGSIKPLAVLKPGEQIPGINGTPLATSTVPRTEILPEGASLASIPSPVPGPPSAPTSAGATGSVPPVPGAAAPTATVSSPGGGATILASSPPRLTPEESRSQAAALVTAKKYNVPFNPNVDPRNPLKQLPPERQVEAAQLAREMNEDPDIRADRLRQYQLMEQMKGIQVMLLQTQMGNIPTDANYRQMAASVVDHTLSPDELRMLRSGGMRGWDPTKVFAYTKDIDPKFSWEKAENEYKAMSTTERAFTSGANANTVRANNVALEHLGMLDEAREAMNNGNIPVLNSIANNIGVQIGKTGKTTYDTIAQAVGKEVNKAYVPGGGGQRERMAEASDFSSGKGDNQIKQNIKATVGLMSAQQRGLENQYKNGTYGQGTQSLWTPEALAVRERLIGNAGPPASGAGGASLPPNAPVPVNPFRKAASQSVPTPATPARPVTPPVPAAPTRAVTPVAKTPPPPVSAHGGPPQSVLDQMQENQRVQGSDGSLWVKKNGKAERVTQ